MKTTIFVAIGLALLLSAGCNSSPLPIESEAKAQSLPSDFEILAIISESYLQRGLVGDDQALVISSVLHQLITAIEDDQLPELVMGCLHYYKPTPTPGPRIGPPSPNTYLRRMALDCSVKCQSVSVADMTFAKYVAGATSEGGIYDQCWCWNNGQETEIYDRAFSRCAQEEWWLCEP